MRLTVLIAVLVVGAFTLAGCTPSPPVPVVPSIRWQSEGTSALETDPSVVAVREADLGLQLAANSRNFMQPSFVDTRTDRLARGFYDNWYGTYVTRQRDPLVQPGPSIWLPVSVTPSAGGGSVVVVCDASDEWFVTAEHEPTYDLSQGWLLAMTVESSDDGRLVLSDRQISTDACDATGAPVGVFDPAPTLLVTITEADVVTFDVPNPNRSGAPAKN